MKGIKDNYYIEMTYDLKGIPCIVLSDQRIHQPFNIHNINPSYTFSVSGAIAAAISGYEGTHTFTVTATNMNGKSSEGSLTFSITNSTAGGE